MLGVDARFVFCLRNPVGRMVSGYWHQAKKGQERRSLKDCLSFESRALADALKEEDEHLQYAIVKGLIDHTAYTDSHDDPLWNFRYLRNSLYTDDILRFQEVFGAARTKVLFFEELIIDPMATLSSLASFLDLEPNRFPARIHLHRNQTRLARVPRLASVLRRLPGRKLAHRVPGYEGLRDRLFYRSPPPADPILFDDLHSLVAPDVARLEVVVNRNLAPLWGAPL
jgi:hypothetical protein